MAVADIIGTLVQAQFLETLRSQPRIVAITRPVNIPNGHSTVRIPKADTSVTVTDYVAGTAMVRERYVPTHVDVAITDQKYVDVYIDDTEEVQTLPNLIADVGTRGANALADEIGDDLATELIALPDAQRTLGGGVQISGANNWNAAKRATLVAAMSATAAAAKKAGFPQDRLVWLTSFEIEEQLINYLTADKETFGTGRFSEAAFASLTLPTIFGASVLVDGDIPYSEVAGVKDFLYLIINGRSLAYAQQLRTTRLVRPHDLFGTDFQALAMYGAKRVDDTFFRKVGLTVS